MAPGEAADALLTGGARRDRFLGEYAFFVQPASDDRPHFFDFFRWRALPMMLRTGGFAWIPFVARTKKEDEQSAGVQTVNTNLDARRHGKITIKVDEEE